MTSSDVSRETEERLNIYLKLLRHWNKAINLVAPDTIARAEERHFEDSLQLLGHTPADWATWVDLGSGGGFPGLVVAMANPKKVVTLIESDRRKAGFLRSVIRETAVDAKVICDRIESVHPIVADVVSARALAPLTKLLGYVERHMSPSGTALLPKGRLAAKEVETALAEWQFDCETLKSRTDPNAVILKIGDIKRARSAGK